MFLKEENEDEIKFASYTEWIEEAVRRVIANKVNIAITITNKPARKGSAPINIPILILHKIFSFLFHHYDEIMSTVLSWTPTLNLFSKNSEVRPERSGNAYVRALR